MRGSRNLFVGDWEWGPKSTSDSFFFLLVLNVFNGGVQCFFSRETNFPRVPGGCPTFSRGIQVFPGGVGFYGNLQKPMILNAHPLPTPGSAHSTPASCLMYLAVQLNFWPSIYAPFELMNESTSHISMKQTIPHMCVNNFAVFCFGMTMSAVVTWNLISF